MITENEQKIAKLLIDRIFEEQTKLRIQCLEPKWLLLGCFEHDILNRWFLNCVNSLCKVTDRTGNLGDHILGMPILKSEQATKFEIIW